MVQLKESWEFQLLGGELACSNFTSNRFLDDTLKHDTIYSHHFLHKTNKLCHIILTQFNSFNKDTHTKKRKRKKDTNHKNTMLIIYFLSNLEQSELSKVFRTKTFMESGLIVKLKDNINPYFYSLCTNLH